MSIVQFIHCAQCLAEWSSGAAEGQSPRQYARHEVGFTKQGLQVRCTRHDLNIIHIDFEGCKHPADTSQAGNFGEETHD